MMFLGIYLVRILLQGTIALILLVSIHRDIVFPRSHH